MDRRELIRLLGSATAIVFVPGLTACYYEPRPYPSPPSPPHYYDYYYYPNVDVYFHIHTGWYYYRSGGIWWRTRRLPPRVRLDPRYRRPIVIREDPPHRRYPQHRKAYPPPRDWRPDPRRDREEREHNRHQHEEYLRRWKKK